MLFEQKLFILTYHRVLQTPDPLRPDQTDAAMFEKHAAALNSYFNVLALEDAAVRLEQGLLPNRAVVVTFDDGYADNATVALPILLKNNLPATFFIATGFLDGGRMWNDTVIEAIRNCARSELDLRDLNLGSWRLRTQSDRQATISELIRRLKYLDFSSRHETIGRIAHAAGADLPENLMMSSDQVRQLADNGMSIGAHTVNHPILARLDTATARREIEQSKTRLEDITGRPVSTFAYPNGKPGSDYTRAHVDMLRELGFRAAVTTAFGCARRHFDPLQLPRIVSWDRTKTRFTLRVLRAGFGSDAMGPDEL